LGLNPPFGPCSIDDLDLNLLDRHRVLINPEDASGFTRRRTESPGELGEIIGGVKPIDRVSPAIVEHEIIPIGNQIPQRATVIAEGDAAIHASACLFANLCDRKIFVDLSPVSEANWNFPARREFTIMFQKPT